MHINVMLIFTGKCFDLSCCASFLSNSKGNFLKKPSSYIYLVNKLNKDLNHIWHKYKDGKINNSLFDRRTFTTKFKYLPFITARKKNISKKNLMSSEALEH